MEPVYPYRNLTSNSDPISQKSANSFAFLTRQMGVVPTTAMKTIFLAGIALTLLTALGCASKPTKSPMNAGGEINKIKATEDTSE